jgi:hypothetical protein
MLKRRHEIADKEQRARLHKAYAEPAYHCSAPYRGPDGFPYRLEPKPRARQHILEKCGFVTEMVDGVLHVRVPLGCHDADHLGIDPATGEIGCVLCREQQQQEKEEHHA